MITSQTLVCRAEMKKVRNPVDAMSEAYFIYLFVALIQHFSQHNIVITILSQRANTLT